MRRASLSSDSQPGTGRAAVLEGVNVGGIALPMNLSFVEEGRRRRQMFFNGQYHDEILFGMTREEFDATEGKRRLDDKS